MNIEDVVSVLEDGLYLVIEIFYLMVLVIIGF